MESTRALIRRVQEELFGRGRTELLEELVHEDFVNHTPMQGLPSDREGLRAELRVLHDAASDVQGPADDILVDGHDVAWRWRFLGRHTGEFMGIQATGRRFELSGIDIGVVRDGKLAEWWSEVDLLDLMTQLGVVEPPNG